MKTPASRYLNSNGLRLHFLDWGGDGSPIVILHATGFLGRVYRPIAERLRQVGHVYSLDQRGHGDSDKHPHISYEWQDTIDDLALFIESLEDRPVRALGHSAGATAIGVLAADRPDLIASGVLVEPVLFEQPDGPEMGWRNPFVERTLKRKRVFDSVDSMFDNFDRKPPYSNWRKDVLRDYCEHGTFESPDGKRELKCPPEIEARFYDRSREFDGLSRMLEGDRPLLVLLGTRPDALGAVFSERLRRELKNGRVVDVADSGHLLPMELPDQVANLAAEFFTQQDS